MKNIKATNGTSLMETFLMEDRSTVLFDAKSTVTPKGIRLTPMVHERGTGRGGSPGKATHSALEPWVDVRSACDPNHTVDRSTGQLVDRLTTHLT